MTTSTQDGKPFTVERKLVRYDNTATDIRASLSAAFGRMVELAAPVVPFHLGDLFYDARWLHEHAAGPTFTFLWSVEDTGTSIGTSPELVLNRAHGYCITLALDDDHRTWLTIEHAAYIPHADTVTTETDAGSGTVSGALPAAVLLTATEDYEAAPDRGAA